MSTLNNTKKKDVLQAIKDELATFANPQKAIQLSRFFKTGKGEYAEGDKFIGVTVPLQRQIAKKYFHIDLNKLVSLLNEDIHEYRLTALLILVQKYQKSAEKEKNNIINIYINNTHRINNWDLVDLSSEKILGEYLVDRDRSIIYKLAESNNIWEQRIAIISTFRFIKNNDFQDTINLCKLYLSNRHDLIHKASGWMLREIGKRDETILRNFLNQYHKVMPRTMLRYSIEKLDEKSRKRYMKKNQDKTR